LAALQVSARAAVSADAQRVAAIVLASRRTLLPYAPLAHADADVQAWVRATLISSGGVTVAQADHALVAVLATARAAAASRITQLYVDPGFVGQGVATRLLGHALATLPLPIRLFTFQPNLRARHFYERHGFWAIEFSDGRTNGERCRDVLYGFAAR
jgi:GNAT superfamily N-acetyltransferase